MFSANRFALVFGVIAFWFASDELASAVPTFGADCTRCHYVTSNRFTLTGTSAVNLNRPDRQKPGAVQTFTVKRGRTVNIPVRVINVGVSNFSGAGNPLYSGSATTITSPLTVNRTCSPDYDELYVRVGGIDQTGRWVRVQRIHVDVE